MAVTHTSIFYARAGDDAGGLRANMRPLRLASGTSRKCDARIAGSTSNVGSHFVVCRAWLLCLVDCLRLRLRHSLARETPMLVDYALGGAVTAVLLIYLVYALLRPEKF